MMQMTDTDVNLAVFVSQRIAIDYANADLAAYVFADTYAEYFTRVHADIQIPGLLTRITGGAGQNGRQAREQIAQPGISDFDFHELAL
jgi:hypothetical protein